MSLAYTHFHTFIVVIIKLNDWQAECSMPIDVLIEKNKLNMVSSVYYTSSVPFLRGSGSTF